MNNFPVILGLGLLALAVFSGCIAKGEDIIYLDDTTIISGSKSYTGIHPIDINNDANIISLDGNIESIVQKLKQGNNITISCTGDDNGICTITSTAAGGGTGRTYTGTHPIMVDNDANTIALDGNIESIVQKLKEGANITITCDGDDNGICTIASTGTATTDTTLDTNAAAETSWLGKSHNFKVDQNFQRINIADLNALYIMSQRIDINRFMIAADNKWGYALDINGRTNVGIVNYPVVINAMGGTSIIPLSLFSTSTDVNQYVGNMFARANLDHNNAQGFANWFLWADIAAVDLTAAPSYTNDILYMQVDNDSTAGDIGAITIDNEGSRNLATGIKLYSWDSTAGFNTGIQLNNSAPFSHAGIDMQDSNLLNAGDINLTSGYVEFAEISIPLTPLANHVRLYVQDDNSGTSRIYILDDAGIETDLTGGGGGCTTLDCLYDVSSVAYTSGYVLRADGSGYVSAQLAHSDLSGIGTNTHDQIDTHISDISNPHQVTAAQVGAVDLTTDQTVGGIKTFSSFIVLPTTSPTSDYQATHKSYVDSIAKGLEVKMAVRVATTEDINRDSLGTVDGVDLNAGDRVLIKNDENAAENGIYVAEEAVWTRATDYDETAEVQEGTFFYILEGAVNINKQFVQIVKDPVLGDSDLNFTQLSAPTVYTGSLGVEKVGLDFRADLYSAGAVMVVGNELSTKTDNNSIYISDNNLTVKALGITNAMLAGDIADSKLNTITTANKVNWAAINMTGSVLDNIGDVDAGAPSDNQVLTWDAGTSTWVPETVAAGGGSGMNAAVMDVDVVSSTTVSSEWTNMPAAATEIFAGTYNRVKLDLQYATHYRLVVNQAKTGATNSILVLQYSTNGTTFIDANANIDGNVRVGGTGVRVGEWTELASGAKTDVWLRLAGAKGNGTADPAWRQIRIQFKMLAVDGPGVHSVVAGDDIDVNANEGSVLVTVENDLNVLTVDATKFFGKIDWSNVIGEPTFYGGFSQAQFDQNFFLADKNVSEDGNRNALQAVNFYATNITAPNIWVADAQGIQTSGGNLLVKADADDYLSIRNNIGYYYVGGNWEYQWTTAAFAAYTDSANTLGASTVYWASTFTDDLNLNATAGISGTTAGTAALTGNLDIIGAAPWVSFRETDQANSRWYVVVDGNSWSVRPSNTGIMSLTVYSDSRVVLTNDLNVSRSIKAVNTYSNVFHTVSGVIRSDANLSFRDTANAEVMMLSQQGDLIIDNTLLCDVNAGCNVGTAQRRILNAYQVRDYASTQITGDIREFFTFNPDYRYEEGDVVVIDATSGYDVKPLESGSETIVGVVTNLASDEEFLFKGKLLVAIYGRLPDVVSDELKYTKVVGTIHKGDKLVASDFRGVVTSMYNRQPLLDALKAVMPASEDQATYNAYANLQSCLGTSLSDYDSKDVGYIEVMVGKC